jgi:hypothetical protein
MKTLEIGQNYGECFGLDAKQNKKMIYLGDNKWQAINGEKNLEKICEKTSAKVLEYINRPSIQMGNLA